MTAQIIDFPGSTSADWPPEVTLDKAKNWNMAECVVVGFDANGKLHFGGSTSDMGHILLLLEGAKLNLLGRIES